MGWRGDPYVRTPHRSTSSWGTAQTACYCASPLCVPSRCSMLSTLLPQNTGIFTNDQCLPDRYITFAHEIGNAGYRTVLAGRMHFKGPDRFHGFHERLVGDIGDPSWNGGSKKSSSQVEKRYTQYGAGHAVLAESGPGDSRLLAYDRDVIDAACDRLRQVRLSTGFFRSTTSLYS